MAVTLATDSVWDAGYFYVVTVLTGWKEWAGTSSSVGIRISGEAGGGATHVLHGHPQEYFLRGGEDWFLLAERSCLGDLKELDVWHSCTGNQPFWWVIMNGWVAVTYRFYALTTMRACLFRLDS